MGKQEEASRERSKRNHLRKLILETVDAAGVLHSALVAPTVLSTLKHVDRLLSRRQKDVISRASDTLIAAGFMAWSQSKLRLTPKGEKELRRLSLAEFSAHKPRKWDGKWRVLIFDIPEYRRGLRQRLRAMLRAIGFYKLQNSVWVYPYDCEDLILLLKADYHVGNDLLYMIVDSIERDKHLREYFDLA